MLWEWKTCANAMAASRCAEEVPGEEPQKTAATGGLEDVLLISGVEIRNSASSANSEVRGVKSGYHMKDKISTKRM